MAKNKNEATLDKKLIAVYEQHGVETFLNVCAQMLDIRARDQGEKKKKVNGEVCEIVLRVLSKRYLEKKGIQGQVFQSVILGDAKNPSNPFKTELDFTLLTPQVCLTGECKSFVGDITIVDDCTLVRGDLKADVARQTLVHARALKDQLEKFALPNIDLATPPFGVFCFVYSNGTLTDKRASAKKVSIPVVTIKSLYRYYDQVFSKLNKKVYDFEKASQTFKRYSESEALHKAHRDYLGY